MNWLHFGASEHSRTEERLVHGALIVWRRLTRSGETEGIKVRRVVNQPETMNLRTESGSSSDRNSDRLRGHRMSNMQENVRVRRKEAAHFTLRSASQTAALHAGICIPASCHAPQTSYIQLHLTTALHR